MKTNESLSIYRKLNFALIQWKFVLCILDFLLFIYDNIYNIVYQYK